MEQWLTRPEHRTTVSPACTLTRVKATPANDKRERLAPFRGGVIGGYDIGVAWKLPNEAVRRVVNRSL